MHLSFIPYTHIPYLGVLAVLLAASFGLPVPEDVPLLTGGYLCYSGYGNVYIMIMVGFIGVLVGDIFLFSIGRKFGHHVVEHRWIRAVVNPPRLLLAEQMFQRHGIKIVFFGRFLPVLRPMIFMAAGVLKVPISRFIVVNGLAACLSVPTMVLLGNFFGHNIDQLRGDVRTATHLLALIIIVSAAVVTVVFMYRRQRRLMDSAGLDEKLDEAALSEMAPLSIQKETDCTGAEADPPYRPNKLLQSSDGS